MSVHLSDDLTYSIHEAVFGPIVTDEEFTLADDPDVVISPPTTKKVLISAALSLLVQLLASFIDNKLMNKEKSGKS
jgi:hypothetical protein